MAFLLISSAFLYTIFCCFILPHLGYKLMEHIDPEPPLSPDERELETEIHCVIGINGITYRCLKKIHMLYSYRRNLDGDVIEQETKHIRYELEQPIMIRGLDEKIIVKESGGAGTECSISADRKNLIACNPICSERVYAYRKPWKHKRSA